MIDWDRLTGLRNDIGEEDFADVVFLFVAEMGEHIERMVENPAAVTAADFHFLRGSAANLGFEGLSTACTTAEAACNAGQPADVTSVAAMFYELIDVAKTAHPELGQAA